MSVDSVGYCAYSSRRSEASGLTSYVNTMRDVLTRRGVRTRIAVSKADPGDPDVIFLRTQAGTRRLGEALSRMAPAQFSRINERLAVARAALQLDRSERISLLEFEEHAGLCDLALRLPLRCPIVVRLHGPHFLKASENWDSDTLVREAMERKVVLRAAAVTAPSEDTLRRVREHWQVKLPNAVVIPNPTPVVEARDCWAGRSDGPILFVGCIDKAKGIDLVVRAFREIAPDHPGRELWLVGPMRQFRDGIRLYRTADEFLCQELPDGATRARVKYLGQRTQQEILEYRKQCACVVVASRFETFCLAAAEALMSGCPTVSSDATALAEVVEHRTNGLSFRSGDVQSLVQSLTCLLEQPDLAHRLSEQARKTSIERYAPDRIVDQTLDFYAHTVRTAKRVVSHSVL